jgi:hypothetical protein
MAKKNEVDTVESTPASEVTVRDAPPVTMIARHVIVRSSVRRFVRSRAQHRAAILQWKLRKVQLGL